MAQLWVRRQREWAIVNLDGVERDVVRFGSWQRDEAVLPPTSQRPPTGPVLPTAPSSLATHDLPPRQGIVRIEAPAGPVWIVLSEPGLGVHVNGLPLAAGIHVLADRDEIRVESSEVFYFSTESLAEVVPLPAADHEMDCPRCRQAIDPDSPAVRCPGCDVWYHASDELGCWAYAPTCALCPQETAAGAGFRWTPDGL